MEDTKKAKTTHSILSSLYHDIFFHIFLKFPIETLLTFKSVCKSWYNIINDPEFTYMHLEKGPKEIFTLAGSKTRTDFKFYQVYDNPKSGIWSKTDILVNTAEFEKDVGSRTNKQIVGSCNGLICLRTHKEFYIMNPFSPQNVHKVTFPYAASAAALSELLRCGFGFDDSTRKFKIVCIIIPEDKIVKSVLVYDIQSVMSSSSSRWRKIISPLSIRFHGYKCNKRSIFVNGSIYWTMKNEIVSFKLNKESFEIIHVPPYLICSNWGFLSPKIFDLDGNLGMLVSQRPGNKIWVWVLVNKSCNGGEGEKNEWVKKLSIKSPYCEATIWYNVAATFLNTNCIMLQKRCVIIGAYGDRYPLQGCFTGNMETGVTIIQPYLDTKDHIMTHRGSLISFSNSY